MKEILNLVVENLELIGGVVVIIVSLLLALEYEKQPKLIRKLLKNETAHQDVDPKVYKKNMIIIKMVGLVVGTSGVVHCLWT